MLHLERNKTMANICKKEYFPVPMECIQRSLTRFIYSHYLRGHSSYEIQLAVKHHKDINMEEQEVNYIIDSLNESLL